MSIRFARAGLVVGSMLLGCGSRGGPPSGTATGGAAGAGGTTSSTGTGGTSSSSSGVGTSSSSSGGAGGGDAGSPVHYAGSLARLICDVKRPLAGMDAVVDTSNYKAIVDGFKGALGCNGIRIYIDPSLSDFSQYPAIYTDVLTYARQEYGMNVYANPLATGSFGKTNADYAAWIVAYANTVKPDFIGPFNESGLGATDLADIAGRVRMGLTYATTLVGPDAQHVEGSQALLTSSPALSASFDVFGSHNAVSDDGATTAAWNTLAQTAGIHTWATEDPRDWSDQNASAMQVGVEAVTLAQVRGLVLYEAFPSLLDASGVLTPKGATIAMNVLQ